jgi:hydrogenase nickel incorporation protein HypB
MCGVCGCGNDEVHAGGEHEHVGPDGTVFRHRHEHPHEHGHEHAQARKARIVQIEQDILARNGELARANRQRFEAAGVLVLNLMSSPGAGKTTLLVRTLERLRGRVPLSVIEGDQQTSLDADRIRQTGVPALQINTGKGCHLDAAMIGEAAGALPLPRGGVLFIENVGNLVCPAGFDLGEARRVVLVSVTEGEDKPRKYPDMFASADLVLITKTDLLPHLDVRLDDLVDNARRVRPGVEVLSISARSDAGIEPFVAWLLAQLPVPAR